MGDWSHNAFCKSQGIVFWKMQFCGMEKKFLPELLCVDFLAAVGCVTQKGKSMKGCLSPNLVCASCLNQNPGKCDAFFVKNAMRNRRNFRVSRFSIPPEETETV